MTREESIKLTVKSLLEVVQTGAKNIEISVMESYGKVTVSGFVKFKYHLTEDLQNLELSEIEAIVSEIEREKEAGKLKFYIDCGVAVTIFPSRGGTKAVEIGCHCCWPGSYESAHGRLDVIDFFVLVLLHCWRIRALLRKP